MVEINSAINISGASAWKPNSGATDSESSTYFVKDPKDSYLHGIETLAKRMGRVGITNNLVMRSTISLPLWRRVPENHFAEAKTFGNPAIAKSGYYFLAPLNPWNSLKLDKKIPFGASEFHVGGMIHGYRLTPNQVLGYLNENGETALAEGPGVFVMHDPCVPLGVRDKTQSKNKPRYFDAATDIFTVYVDQGEAGVFQVDGERKVLEAGPYAIKSPNTTFEKMLSTKPHDIRIPVTTKVSGNTTVRLDITVRGQIDDPFLFANRATQYRDLEHLITDRLKDLVVSCTGDIQVTDEVSLNTRAVEGHDVVDPQEEKKIPALQQELTRRITDQVSTKLEQEMASFGAALKQISLTDFRFNDLVQAALDQASSDTINTNKELRNANKRAQTKFKDAQGLANAEREKARGAADAKKTLADADAYAVIKSAEAEATAIGKQYAMDQTVEGDHSQAMQLMREKVRLAGNAKSTVIFDGDRPSAAQAALIDQK
jgi:regulator of protease activity HflC (stomatin/prohibitin superfamily)